MAKQIAFKLLVAALILTGCKTTENQSALRDNGTTGGGPTFSGAATMDIKQLRDVAFQRCQAANFVRPNPAPVPDLDPPQFNSHGIELHYLPNGILAPENQAGEYPANAVKGKGIDYSEEGLIAASRDIYSDQDFFFRSRPRSALNTVPVQLFVKKTGSANYDRVTWDMAGFDYSDPGIKAPIDAANLAAAGKVLTKLIVGHKTPQGGWPQIFDYGSTGYLRFQGYSQVPGASFRTAGAHNVFGTEYFNPHTNKPTSGEDFGLLQAAFFSVKDSETTNVLALVEGDLFCGALDINMSPGEESVVEVDSYWYTRRDFVWKEEPNTGFVTYSSMFYQNAKPTTNNHHDEHTDGAHDSDTLIVNYKDGTNSVFPIKVPTANTNVYDPPKNSSGSFVVGLYPNFSAGRFKVGETVEIWSGVAAGVPRTSDGTKQSWKILALDPQIGILTLEGDHTSASTIGAKDFLFVQGQRLYVTDVTEKDGNKAVQGFLLENVDRDPKNYTYYRQALKESSYEHRASYGVKILASNVKTGVRLIEHAPDKEYLDNIVAFSCLRQDIPKSKSADDFSRFHYKTWSCYPGSKTCPSPDQLTNVNQGRR